MVYKIKAFQKQPLIDFVIAVAHKGGVENVMNQVARYLINKGVKVRFIQLIYENQPWACEEVEFHYIYTGRNNQTLEDFINGYYGFWQENGTPDMIIATNWPMMSTVARAAAEKAGANIPIASWLHSTIERYEKAGYGNIDNLRHADLHFAINDDIKKILLKNNEINTYRAYNPIDASKVYFNSDRMLKKLIYVGRLSKEKNISVIINALSCVEDYELLIVGEGEEEKGLINLVKQLKLESRVAFCGWSDNPWLLAKECGFLVMSSLYEGFPLTVIEALSCGIPVISTPVAGVTELIENGINGYLYPQNDYKALAEVLTMLSEKKLSRPPVEVCKASVCRYKEDVALFDFYSKVNATLERRIIKEDNDKISIIVPCYNVEKLVGRCIDSILTQTIPNELIELILVNDASTDNTLEELMNYEEKYPEMIMVINCQENGKQGRARNIGLDYASGNYIMFVDADDYIADTMLEKMYLAALKYPVDVVECKFRMFDDNGWIQPESNDDQDRLVLIENIEERKNYFISCAFDCYVWRKLYKRSFINDANIYFPENIYMEDLYFGQLCTNMLKSVYEIDEQLYFYYKNTNGTKFSDRFRTYYMDVHKVQAMLIEELSIRNLLNDKREALAYVYFKKVLLDIYMYIRKTFGEISGEHKVNLCIMKDYLEKLGPDMLSNPYMSQEDREFYYDINNSL